MIAKVITLRPLQEELFYNTTDSSTNIGSKVLIPLRKGNTVGFVREFLDELPKSEKKFELKDIISILNNETLISSKMYNLFYWIKDYYFYPIGEIVKSALPRLLLKNKTTNIEKYLIQEKSNQPDEIEARLIDNLNESQINALEIIKNNPTDKPILLHGITGSGKTEVYINFIKEILSQEKTALVLVPEIALTPQLIARFKKHFPFELGIFHSEMTDKERLCEWLKVKYSKIKLAIGVRSAIFLPFDNLGVIIVDEEHENSFKQDDRLKYNARDIAILRGKLENAKVILGSATPSFESYYRSQNGLYTYISLPIKASQIHPTKYELIDLKNKNNFYKKTLLTNELFNALKENLNNNKQSLLFLNRTGFSTYILCVTCGQALKCPNCSISLIYYKSLEKISCPYCDYSTNQYDKCTNCGSNSLIQQGAGTERLEEDLKKHLPSAHVLRMDRETVQTRGSRKKILSEVSEGKADILIGTQMIAKGMDFHNITLVGVINADLSLNIPDFRSAERTFGLLTQVSGRSGRGEHEGKVIIQTYNPDHYAIKYISNENYSFFYENELPFRRDLFYPPFYRLINIKVSSMLEYKAKKAANDICILFRKLIDSNHKWRNEIILLGPGKQAIFKVRNKFRYHILLKGRSPGDLNTLIKTVIKNNYKAFKVSQVQISIDVDPLNLM